MLDTISVFDNLELDNTAHRVASRRALALAHKRVETNLGRFLRAAQSEEEFLERLGLVQEEFGGYIATASAEVGHEHPEHIAAALKDHYRLAAQPVEFTKTPEEKLEEDEEEKTSSLEQIAPKQARKALKRMAKAGRTWKQAMPLEGEQGSPLAGENSQGQYPILPGDEHHHTCPQCGSMNHESDPLTGNPLCLNCGYSGEPANPYGDDEGLGLGGQHGYPSGHMIASQGDADAKVTCPECGGDGKTAGAKSCPKCGGKGKVPNFGDPVAQEYTSRTADDQGNPFPLDPNQPFPGGEGGRPNHVRILQEQGRQVPPERPGWFQSNPAQSQHPDPWMDNEPGAMTFPPEWSAPGGLSEGLRGPRPPENPYPYHTGAENQNNTDLGGPEPKMDKAEWTRSNPGQPDYKDGPRHPTEKKDITEVIGPMRNYKNHSDLDEIHGQGTHFKNETLPGNSGDAGFDGGGPGPAPHTDTFGNDGQVDPVTRQSLETVQSSDKNPLSELLLTEWPSEQTVKAALLQP